MSANIEFFFDISSPYSYLAATQIEAVAARAGGTARWRPFLLGGVFKSVGNKPPASLPARGRYMLTDLYRWAAEYDVPFEFPSTFPMNSLLAMRALMGHASPETTSRYVHLSVEHLAAEYAAAAITLQDRS